MSGYLWRIRYIRVSFLLNRCTWGSISPWHATSSNTSSWDRLAELGPTALAMAVCKAFKFLVQHWPTSEPYKAAGRIMACMVCTLCCCVRGSQRSRFTQVVARRSLLLRVAAWLDLSRHKCAPKSRKWLTTLMVVVAGSVGSGAFAVAVAGAVMCWVVCVEGMLIVCEAVDVDGGCKLVAMGSALSLLPLLGWWLWWCGMVSECCGKEPMGSAMSLLPCWLGYRPG